jgi:hypothetical protein
LLYISELPIHDCQHTNQNLKSILITDELTKNSTIFWIVTPCSPVNVLLKFRRNARPLFSRSKSRPNKRPAQLDLLFYPEDGRSTFLRNIPEVLSDYTALQHRLVTAVRTSNLCANRNQICHSVCPDLRSLVIDRRITELRFSQQKSRHFGVIYCGSPNLLQFSVDAMDLFSPFGRVTGLLARPIY